MKLIEFNGLNSKVTTFSQTSLNSNSSVVRANGAVLISKDLSFKRLLLPLILLRFKHGPLQYKNDFCINKIDLAFLLKWESQW